LSQKNKKVGYQNIINMLIVKKDLVIFLYWEIWIGRKSSIMCTTNGGDQEQRIRTNLLASKDYSSFERSLWEGKNVKCD
jgi:hypothetical protein